MRIFDSHIPSFVWNFMPPFLKRHESVYGLFYALSRPLWEIRARFLQKQNEVNFQIAYRPQKIYLEQGLNDKFNPLHNGIFNAANGNIYIEVLNAPPTVYEFQYIEYIEFDAFEDTDTESLLTNNFQLTESEVIPILNYRVYVPLALNLDFTAVRGFVDKYNPVGKIYEITGY